MRPHRRKLRTVEAVPGLLVEVASSNFAGAIVRATADGVVLRDRRGRERRFGLHPGAFYVDDQPVHLVPPVRRPAVSTYRAETASGSLAVDTPARIAQASRLWVEGRHDAELVERVWGDDLRVEGIVVEPLDGIDDLTARIRSFGPSSDRRLGVLVDHLVDGSKESRIASEVTDPDVLITGHPFVDVWAAVKPEVLGLAAWPEVPRDQDWKQAIAAVLGEPDPPSAWRLILAAVNRYTDLDRRLVGAVERLIDFVTVPDMTS